MSDTTRRRYRVMVIALALFLLLLVAVFEYVSRSRYAPGGWGIGLSAAPVERSPVVFAISGSISVPLLPGHAAPLDLVVENPGEEDLVIRDIQVKIISIDAPNATTALPCSSADFRINQGRGQLEVKAGKARSLSDSGWSVADRPSLGMLDTELNQDGCKSADVNLEYSAVGSPP